MLLRHRPPRIESTAAEPAKQGYEHLDESWLTLLRWLQASRVEFVLVGPAARAIRGEAGARGPVTIVPAPYGRNLDRLARALWSGHARLRVDAGPAGAGADTVPVKLTAEKLVRGERWTLRCGSHDLDIEGRRARAAPALPGAALRGHPLRARGAASRSRSPRPRTSSTTTTCRGRAWRREMRITAAPAQTSAEHRSHSARGALTGPRVQSRLCPDEPRRRSSARRSGSRCSALTWGLAFHVGVFERADRAILKWLRRPQPQPHVEHRGAP